MKKSPIAVFGSGISGLSIGHIFKDIAEVEIFELHQKIGGLIKCDRVKDCLFHRVGGHVFNSKNKEVLSWFWSFFDRDKEFISARRNAKILFEGNVIGYPFENYLYHLNPNLVKVIVRELISCELKRLNQEDSAEDFQTFLINNFGNTLFQIYFEPYNRKIWQTDLETVPMDWLDGKLPMPNVTEIIANNIVRQGDDQMVHSTFYYPVTDGSQFIVDRLAKGLNIQTLAAPQVYISDRKLYLDQKRFDKLIYTGDIRQLPESIREILIKNGVDWKEVLALQSNGTSNLFCETDDTDISWMYIPEDFTKAHRIIYTGNFSPTNNRGSHRKTCVVEFSGYCDYDSMTEEIKRLPGNLVPLASNFEPNSYVIQTKSTRKLIAAIKAILEQNHIYLSGRFAEWEYYNMDKAIEAAFLLKKKFLNEANSPTYPNL